MALFHSSLGVLCAGAARLSVTPVANTPATGQPAFLLQHTSVCGFARVGLKAKPQVCSEHLDCQVETLINTN